MRRENPIFILVKTLRASRAGLAKEFPEDVPLILRY
jgi:hypothetical protein